MTTENLPVRWDEELAKYATQQASLERPAVGRIAFRGGVMTYQNQPIPGNKLDVVIVASAKEHALYQNVLDNRPFDPNKPENPICYALSLSGEDMVPHPQSKHKKAASCAECPFNAWGSAPNGSRGKACKESRRLVMVPRSAVSGSPDALKKAESATASVPVTSVKNWANYLAQLSTEYRRPSWAMVTEMAIIPNAKTVFEVKFSPSALVDASYFQDLLARVKTSEPIVMTPYPQESNAAPAQPLQGRKY